MKKRGGESGGAMASPKPEESEILSTRMDCRGKMKKHQQGNGTLTGWTIDSNYRGKGQKTP